MRTPQTLSVLMTRSWVGALRAVTSAVRIGDSFPLNLSCMVESVSNSFAKGP